MDDPTAMPEGTVPSLVVDDEGDSLDERERAALHDAIERTWATAQTAPGRDARDVIADLRARCWSPPPSRRRPRRGYARWRSERPPAPSLFVDELAEAREMTRHFVGAGLRVPRRNVPCMRRVLLRASRFHVDDVEQPASVVVLTVWSAVRGRGPDLGRL